MSINRRQFLAASASGLALTLTAFPLLSSAKTDSPSWKEMFHHALGEKPYLSAYRSVTQDYYASAATLTGKWPKALAGTLFRNGPAQHEIGDFRYQHWFDGDGMIHAYKMSDAGVSHKARMIGTRKYAAEQSAGRALYPGFATMPDNPAPVTSPDLVNVGNISVLPHHDKLMALWEAGSPWEIDPETLETRGIYSFSQHTKGVPFSAHPKVEPDGTLWNFGYLSGANLLVFWHIDAKGNIVKMGKVDSDPISMPHDFVVTENHLILMMPPLHYEQSSTAKSFLDAHKWYPNEATRVLIVDKNDFSKHRWLELPSQWVFHFANAYEDKSGVIHFAGSRTEDPSVMTHNFREIMKGVVTEPASSQLYQYQIDTKKWRISEQAALSAGIDTEFPCVDPRLVGRESRRMVLMSSDTSNRAGHGALNEVSRFDTDTNELQTYRYPDHQVPEEHLFVPHQNSNPETKGWVVGTAHDWQQQTTVLNVFDFEAVSAGPIATATFPYAMPVGLHGKFVTR